MTKTRAGILAVMVVVVSYVLYGCRQATPPVGALNAVSITISFDSGTNTCSITDPTALPVHVNNGGTVTWRQQQGLPFTVDFPATTALNTGSPFRDSLNLNWQTRFTSLNGSPVPSGIAQLTGWEKFWGIRYFPIQTITVTANGVNQVCYDKNKHEIQGTGIHVDN